MGRQRAMQTDWGRGAGPAAEMGGGFLAGPGGGLGGVGGRMGSGQPADRRGPGQPPASTARHEWDAWMRRCHGNGTRWGMSVGELINRGQKAGGRRGPKQNQEKQMKEESGGKKKKKIIPKPTERKKKIPRKEKGPKARRKKQNRTKHGMAVGLKIGV